jgi:lysine 2,3-aminomutase
MTNIKKIFCVERSKWEDWKWHEQNAIHNINDLFEKYPAFKSIIKLENIDKNIPYHFKITPYMFSLLKTNNNKVCFDKDPIWNQYFPNELDDSYSNISKLRENWEIPEEMITPILQHKYYNRVNFRIQNQCLAYCMYCFEAKRVLDKNSKKESFCLSHLNDSIQYIKSKKSIQEVVISGGEPLMLSNNKLDIILSKIRNINHIKFIRIQTKAFVHNPFRLDDDFINILIKHNVTALAFHISHPNEISKDSINILKKFSEKGCQILLLAHIPLLKGINDNFGILKKLFLKLYELKIKPYYLIHAMPDTLGEQKYRTSVIKGVELLKKLKRTYSNPALPEYIIVHKTGKHTVPLELSSTSEFIYCDSQIKFLNWKNQWCIYQEV